ncbi:MAG TPA: hypothetical protein VFX49_17785 [Chloroflexota bacterium]|nr:hypothetical protein [Chloroflexota bacterium]
MRRFEEFLDEIDGGRPLSAPTDQLPANVLERFYTWLLTLYDREKSTTCVAYVTEVRAFFRFLDRRRWLLPDVSYERKKDGRYVVRLSAQNDGLPSNGVERHLHNVVGDDADRSCGVDDRCSDARRLFDDPRIQLDLLGEFFGSLAIVVIGSSEETVSHRVAVDVEHEALFEQIGELALVHRSAAEEERRVTARPGECPELVAVPQPTRSLLGVGGLAGHGIGEVAERCVGIDRSKPESRQFGAQRGLAGAGEAVDLEYGDADDSRRCEARSGCSLPRLRAGRVMRCQRVVKRARHSPGDGPGCALSPRGPAPG